MPAKISLALLLLVLVISQPAAAAGRVYLVAVPGLGFEDFRQEGLEALPRLYSGGAKGYLNLRTPSNRLPAEAYLALGYGRPIEAPRQGADLLLAPEDTVQGEEASVVFRRRTGREGDGALLHLAIAAFPDLSGSLAEALKGAGKKAAVIGDADTRTDRRRPAAMALMNPAGVVEAAESGPPVLVQDPSFPGGLRTDWDAVRRLTARYGGASLVLVEAGDLLRLEEESPFLTEEALKEARRRAVAGLDGYLGWLLGRLGEEDLLLLFAPRPPGEALREGDLLGACLAYGRGFGPGLLTTATTRRAGVGAVTDLAPTVLDALGVEVPKGYIGRPLTRLEGGDPEYYHRRAVRNVALRSVLIRGYIIGEIALLLLSLLLILWRPDKAVLLPPLILAVTSIPLAFLAVPLTGSASLPLAAAVTIAVAAALGALFLLLGRGVPLRSLAAAGLVTSLVLALDVLGSSELMVDSPLGFSVIGGARYYGIGNEYMGVLVGSSLMAIGVLRDRLPARAFALPAALGLLVLYLLAAPSLGANFGGTIAAAVGFGTALGRPGAGRKAVLRRLAFLGIMALLAAGAYVAMDLLNPGTSSHVGLAASRVAAGGPGVLAEIASRKVAMNLKLIRLTIWSRVFLLSLATYAFLVYRPTGIFRRIVSRYPGLHGALRGITAASLTALVVNDSGIVAAATGMIHAVASLLFVVSKEVIREKTT